ncbi:hypothetical protein J9B83_05105 [Marinomonas sp. A79]|uniref:Uncharacterized protein n=1 Tax=Marinomonas vulgaris TaxID=2823372 RepID=A0ABS5H9E7_9GAMM|nr:hypothetical protein [Marinomonas vulgaris]MBR7888316.1 hypothetical protein [Marinomonas vulgaris]
MTAVTITVLILLIVGFITVVTILQLKEQARIEKLRQIAALNNQIRQVRRYLDDMPPQYQPKDMRLWLLSRKIALYEKLLSLQADGTMARRRDNLAEEMETFQASKQKRRAKPISDELMILDIRRLFDSFKSFLMSSKTEKTISSDVVHRYNRLLHFYHFKVSSDYHAYLARKAFLSGQFDESTELYKEALAQLNPVKDTIEAQPAVAKLKDLLHEIIEDIALQKAEAEIAKHEDVKKEAELDNEWENYINSESFQQKKRF